MLLWHCCLAILSYAFVPAVAEAGVPLPVGPDVASLGVD